MSLSGFYKKAKKKLEDWGSGFKNTFSQKKSGVVDFFNNASSGRQERVKNLFDSFSSSENNAQKYHDEARRIRQETARRRAEESAKRVRDMERRQSEANKQRREQGRLYIGNSYIEPKEQYKDVSLWQETKAKPKAIAKYGAGVAKGLSDISRDASGWAVGKVKGEERKKRFKQGFDESSWGRKMTRVGEFSKPQNRAEEKALKSVEVADIMTGVGTMRQVPKFTGRTDKLGGLVKEAASKPKRAIKPEGDERLARLIKHYKQNSRDFDLNALRGEYSNNPKALKQIDEAEAGVKLARKNARAKRMKEEAYAREINQASNESRLFNPETRQLDNEAISKTRARMDAINAKYGKPAQYSAGKNNTSKVLFPKNQDQGLDAVLEGIENAKKKLPKHTYSQDDIARVSGEALYKTDKEFMPIFSRWIADRELAKTKAYEVASKIQIPRGKERQIINALEGVGSAKGVEEPVRHIRNTYNKLFAEAKQAGVNMNYIDNYITHIWKESPYEVAKKYQTAKKTFQFGGERKVPTYAEGLKMGLTPRYTNPRQIIGHYTQKLEEVKANIRFLERLKQEGHIVDASIGANNPAFTAITAPGFEKSMSGIGDGVIIGNYYAPHDIARKINNALHNPDAGSRLQRVVGGLAKASGAVQDLTMSGGVPKTPINAFGIAQATKEVLAGRFLSPILNMARSSSGHFSRKFFEKNLGSIKQMQARNVPIKTTLDLDSLGETKFLQKAFFGNVSNERGIKKLNAVRNAWRKTMNEPTFARYMSQLQIQLFNDIKAKALKGGVMRRARNEEEAADIAAQAVKNFYGLQNTAKQAIKDPLAKDLVSTIFFAPRYRSAMINFWWNNVKSFAKPHKLDNATNVKFSAGALLTYAAYDYANYTLNGRHLWDNPQNKEDKLLIPTSEDNKWTDGKTLGLPFLSSIATMPRLGYRTARNLARGDIEAATKDTLATTSSKMIAPFMQIGRNENYFGQPIYNENDSTSGRFRDMGLHLAKEYNHPYIGAGIDMMAGGKARGEVAGRALELPVRFYDPKSVEAGFYYTSRNEVLKKASKEAKAAFERIYGDGRKSDEDKFYDENGLAFNDKRDKMSSALLKLNNFSGLKLQEEIDRKAAERTGSPLNPFWNLSDDQKRVVLTLDTLYDGEKTKSNIQSANIEWLKPYWNERNAFFDELQRLGRLEGKQNVVKYDGNGQINVAMIDTLLPSDEINAMSEVYYSLPSGTGQRTAFLNQYPQLKNYWEAKNEKTNLDRMALGLPPKENSFSSGGYSRGYGGFYPRRKTSGVNYEKSLSGQKADKGRTKTKKLPPIFKYKPFDSEMYAVQQMIEEMGRGNKIANLPSPNVIVRGVRNVGRRKSKNIRL